MRQEKEALSKNQSQLYQLMEKLNINLLQKKNLTNIHKTLLINISKINTWLTKSNMIVKL